MIEYENHGKNEEENMSTQALNIYITEVAKVYKTGKATEHSYRHALITLFENITSGLTITNEPKHINCGAPDYIITKDEVPLGYIEAKDITVGLNNKSNKEQFDRYKQSLNNLILTDYLTFHLYFEGNSIVSVTIAQEINGVITPEKKQFDKFIELINNFTQYKGKTISRSSDLARLMAAKAKLLSEAIRKALNEKRTKKDDIQDTLSEQYALFRKILIHNLNDYSFADMYSQTLAYGLFAARLNQKSNETFSRKIAAHFIPKSNPFLRKFFMHIAFELDSRICWIVDALADLFNCASIEDIIKEFGKANQDPYIHFYETFLAEYDPSLRKTRGVYYTPLSAVQFIVKAVDNILQEEFSLASGLADNSKIKVPVYETDKKGNKKIKEYREYHKVQILDPATGTGTFLAEVINVIHSHFANQKGKWVGYCQEHLIPRLNGFEFLMASYAMAHFKLDQTLKYTGYIWHDDTNEKSNRLNIYLTNTLEEPVNEASILPLGKWLTDEANEANSIKRDTPVMVILGNPPYSGESANYTPYDFLEPYKKEPGGIEKLKERNPKWINDDYVKFIRYGQNLIEKYGNGVLAFINNHSFLDNPTFRGMRWSLLNTYDKIYILDLHGNAKKKETAPDGSKDENIFDIMQGVSINIFIKTGIKKSGKLAEVYHADIYGEREKKNIILSEKTLSTIKWKKIKPFAPNYYFTQMNFSELGLYNEGFNIQELFPVNGVGITTAHDDFVISDNKNNLLDLFTKFKNSLGNPELLHQTFNVDKKAGWDILKGWNNLQSEKDINKYIKEIMYRPFDKRYIFYEDKLVWRTVKNIMRHFLVGENYGLVFRRQQPESMDLYIFCSNKIIADGYIRSDNKGGESISPLYLYSFDNSSERQPNLNIDIVNAIASKIGFRYIEEKSTDKKTFAPIDILDYIYAYLHSPSYRAKYKEFLKIDFPRIPYPVDSKQFAKLAELGAKLRQIHLMENIEPSKTMAIYPVAGDNIIESISYKNEKVWINKKQYFDAVPKPILEFYIGGYQPALKWLKDRKGKTLNFEEIEHYQKIINVLFLTKEIQVAIDKFFTI